MDLDLVAPRVGNKRTFLSQSTGRKKILPKLYHNTGKKIFVIKKCKSTPCVEAVLILTKWEKAYFIGQIKMEYYICRREGEEGMIDLQ